MAMGRSICYLRAANLAPSSSDDDQKTTSSCSTPCHLGSSPMESSNQLEVAANTAVVVLRSSMPSLTEAEAINLLRDRFQQMAARRSSHKEHNLVVAGTRCLSPAQLSSLSPAAADSRSPTASSGQRGLLGPPPVAAVPPITAGHTLPLDGAAVSRMRRLPGEVKAGRLIQAAKDGAVSELQALLAAGAYVGARDKGTGRTALHWAAARGHTEAARRLVDAGAPMEYMAETGKTPLFMAASMGHVDVVKLLVASSANPNTKDWYMTALEIAVQNGHAEVETVLRDAGAYK